MKPIDYIYENIDCFNLTIFKQILEESGETVSEEIYDYLMETTWNTNPALLKQYGLDIERSRESGGDETPKKFVFTNEEGYPIDISTSDFATGKEFYDYLETYGPQAVTAQVINTDSMMVYNNFVKDEASNYWWGEVEYPYTGSSFEVYSNGHYTIEWGS